MYLTTNPVNRELFKNFEAVRAASINKSAPKNISFEKKEKINLPVLTATAIGTLIPFLIIRKIQPFKKEFIKLCKSNDIKTNLIAAGKNISNYFDLHFGLNELLSTSAGAILGGVTCGIIVDKNKNTKNKIKEGVYQFANQAIPATIIISLLKLTEKNKKLNNRYVQAAAIIAGLGIGLPTASVICNKINNIGNKDKNNIYKRELRIKDLIIHFDDIIMALILAKFPYIDKLGIDKFLPLLSLPCGYEAGTEK